MKMSTLRLRDLLVMFISALVFLPSGATAKLFETDSPTPAPTPPTPEPTTKMPSREPTPSPEPTTPTTALPTTHCGINFVDKSTDNGNLDRCNGYSRECCLDPSITNNCCYWLTTNEYNQYWFCEDEYADGEQGLCCQSYNIEDTDRLDCPAKQLVTEWKYEKELFVEDGGSPGTAVGSALNGITLTGALVMLALVAVGYVVYVLVKRHRKRKGDSYTWPEDETTPIATA